MLIKRENGAEDRVAKASAASVCYRAALHFLDGVDGAAEKQSLLRDASELRGKCLIQHALALHLCGQHDDALRCLDQVTTPELRRDSQDLRFGVLLAVSLSIGTLLSSPLSFIFLLDYFFKDCLIVQLFSYFLSHFNLSNTCRVLRIYILISSSHLPKEFKAKCPISIR